MAKTNRHALRFIHTHLDDLFKFDDIYRFCWYKRFPLFLTRSLPLQLVVDQIDALVHDISSAQYQVCLWAWNGHTNIFHRWKRQQQQTHTHNQIISNNEHKTNVMDLWGP